MINGDIIKVRYKVYASTYSIRKELPKLLRNHDMLSFDTEVRSVYPKKEREEAKEYLKEATASDNLYRLAMMVSNSSGLSYPSITETTHFIFGLDRATSVIFICNDHATEMFIWNEVAKYNGVFLIHNSLFDLKIMYERIGKLPKKFIDTALKAKCLINHVDTWKAKTGLKELVGSYYKPEWSMMDEYEPETLKDENFLDYCGHDGAAGFLVYELIQEEIAKQELSSQ